MSKMLGSVQRTPAQPVALYSSTTARCWCQATITRRVDGEWHHPATPGNSAGIYCRETDR
jgi:hypothetical protein